MYMAQLRHLLGWEIVENAVHVRRSSHQRHTVGTYVLDGNIDRACRNAPTKIY